jgi:hypothetical protein
MPNPSRTHPAPERLAALARGELDGAAAAALRRHLDHCASCREAFGSKTGVRSEEDAEAPFRLAAEPLAPAKPAESLPPAKKSQAGRVRKRRPRHDEPARGGLLIGALVGVAALLVVAIGVGVLVLVRLRPAPAPAEQAQAPAAAPAPAAPIKAVPALEPAKAPAPVPQPPAAAPAPAAPAAQPATPQAAAPAAQAPAQPPPRPAPPLTAEERRWQPTFRPRLAQYGQATCGYDKLKGKPLTGVVVDLEVLAEATHAPLNRTTVTALDRAGAPVPPAVLFWTGVRKPQTVHLDGGVSVTAFPGNVQVGNEKFRFAGGAAMGPLGDLVDKPIAFEEGAGLAYDLHARTTYRVGFLFAADAAQLTAVRLLGHVLPLDPAGRDPGVPVAVKPEPLPEPPADPAPAEPAAGKPDAPARADAPAEPDVYHHVPQVDVNSKSKNIWVRQDGADSWKVGPIGASGEVAADANGADVRLVPDALGSTGLLVVPGRLGYTTLAGLRFYQRARLNIWDDGTVETDQVGVRAKGEDGESYISQRVTLGRRAAVVMVRLVARAAEVPKSVELTDEERNERAAAGKLRVAREAMDDGNRDKARALCEEILKKYPQTRAAPEARKLLGD